MKQKDRINVLTFRSYRCYFYIFSRYVLVKSEGLENCHASVYLQREKILIVRRNATRAFSCDITRTLLYRQ